MVSEIQADSTAIVRLLGKANRESVLITITGVCVVVTIVFAVLAAQANVRSEAAEDQAEELQNDISNLETRLISEQQNNILLWSQKYDQLEASMTKETQRNLTLWTQTYKEMERECRICQVDFDDMRIRMATAGINLDHIGEKP